MESLGRDRHQPAICGVLPGAGGGGGESGRGTCAQEAGLATSFAIGARSLMIHRLTPSEQNMRCGYLRHVCPDGSGRGGLRSRGGGARVLRGGGAGVPPT